MWGAYMDDDDPGVSFDSAAKEAAEWAKLTYSGKEKEAEDLETKQWYLNDQKLRRLAEHFGIETEDENDSHLWALALELARLQFPSKKKGRGRPTKWNAGSGGALVFAVDHEMQRTGKSFDEVIKELAKSEPLATFLDRYKATYKNAPEDALRLQYNRHKDSDWIPAFKTALAKDPNADIRAFLNQIFKARRN